MSVFIFIYCSPLNKWYYFYILCIHGYRNWIFVGVKRKIWKRLNGVVSMINFKEREFFMYENIALGFFMKNLKNLIKIRKQIWKFMKTFSKFPFFK